MIGLTVFTGWFSSWIMTALLVLKVTALVVIAALGLCVVAAIVKRYRAR